MRKPGTIPEIVKMLEQSNCGECGEATCLAFASSVFLRRRGLGDCPKVDPEAVDVCLTRDNSVLPLDEGPAKLLDELKSALSRIDFVEAAERTGGRLSGERLVLSVLGKDFGVEPTGEMVSSIHVNPWVAAPLLSYILSGGEKPVSGRWVSFRDLKGGMERYPLFQKRCEGPIKRVADTYASLFDDMVHVLGGEEVEQQFKSDISVVLHPLPKVPVMICYWEPEDGLESSLHVFFDESAEENLGIDPLYTLVAGLSQMFTKIALTHGFG